MANYNITMIIINHTRSQPTGAQSQSPGQESRTRRSTALMTAPEQLTLLCLVRAAIATQHLTARANARSKPPASQQLDPQDETVASIPESTA